MVETIYISGTYLNVENPDSLAILDSRQESLVVYLPPAKKNTVKTIRLLTSRSLSCMIKILDENNLPSGSYSLKPGVGAMFVGFTWNECFGWLITDGFASTTSVFPTQKIFELSCFDPTKKVDSTTVNSDSSIIVLGQIPNALIYKQCGCKWKLIQTLSGKVNSAYGISVAIDSIGKWLAVGDYLNNQVSIYVLDQNQWYLTQVLSAPVTTAKYTSDSFGYSLAFDAPGQTLLVGAPGFTSPTPLGGTVWIYYRASNTFIVSPCPPLVASVYSSPDHFGDVVDISASGSFVAIDNKAHGYIETFVLSQNCVINESSTVGGTTGLSLSQDGTTLAATASAANQIRVYNYCPSNSSTALAPPIVFSDNYVYLVALSGDGRVIVAAFHTPDQLLINSYTAAVVAPGFPPQTYDLQSSVVLSSEISVSLVNLVLTPDGSRAVVNYFIVGGQTKVIVLG